MHQSKLSSLVVDVDEGKNLYDANIFQGFI